jgi:chorismate-pyruvate lyase
LALDLLQKEGSVTKIIKKMFCIKGNVELTTNKLMGCNLDVETLVEPDEIIWENLAYTGDQQTGRNIIMQIISIIFLIIIAISTMYITGVSLLMDKFAPDVNCPELPVT